MFIKTPLKFNYQNFIHNTSIATSTMMVVKKKLKILNLQIQEFVKTIILNVSY